MHARVALSKDSERAATQENRIYRPFRWDDLIETGIKCPSFTEAQFTYIRFRLPIISCEVQVEFGVYVVVERSGEVYIATAAGQKCPQQGLYTKCT